MVAERNKNDNVKSLNADAAGGKGGKNQQSTVEFPYFDLNSVVAIAKAIHENAGASCTLDQLAAYLKQSISGPFRTRVSNARMFGITENEKGEVRLTGLGRLIADPKTEAQARADAFLNVELYKKLFDKYRGYALPGAKGIEGEMKVQGVAPKQADKARQTFMRSAEQAGFFAHGEDRLVRPAGPGTKPIDAPKGKDGKPEGENRNGGGGDGGGGPDDPLIAAVIQKLPKAGPWSADDRVNWLKLLAMAFQATYGQEDPIEIKKEAAN